MANLLPLVARLRAFEAGRAVSIASQRQLQIQPHALFICSLAMAGEDTTVHAVAVGHAGEDAQTRVVADPRVRDDHFALFEWLLTIVEPYFARCRADGDFPQIWVSSAAGAGHLDTLADRLRYNRDNPGARRLGELLSYATERYPVAGQQALVTATGALRLHFATGQQEGEDEHLGTFLTWIEPPAGRDVLAAVALVEQEPMGVKTDPTFDRDRLVPLVGAYNAARRRGAAATEISRRSERIERELAPIVRRIYAATQRAYAILSAYPARALGVLSDLRNLEAYEFESFMLSRDAGHHLTYHDQPKGAAFKIAAREDAIANVEAGAIHSDAVARTKAYLNGKVLRGTVTNVRTARVGRKTIHTFSIETRQRSLHLRERDELAYLVDARMRCEVEGVQRNGRLTRVALKMIKGMRAVGRPAAGAQMDFGPLPPDWDRLRRERIQMSARLAQPPWTHDDRPPAPAPNPGLRPNDLVSDVESLT